jgi:hypothetical protein
MPEIDIAKAKEKAVKELSKNIDSMGSAAYAILLKQIEEIFDIKGGKIVGGKDFIKQLNKLSVSFLDLLQKDPKFIGPVSKFLKNMPAISDEITKFQKAENGIKVPDFKEKSIITDEAINQLSGNGLNAKFVQPLRELIYQNVTQGSSLTDARNAIKTYIQGGKDISGKLSQYIEQTAQQAVNAYSGIIGKKLFETFDYDAMRIHGALIDNSSPQCIYAVKELNRVIKKSDWPALKKLAEKNGLKDNTEFKDLPLNLLHWGCGHDFNPIMIKK